MHSLRKRGARPHSIAGNDDEPAGEQFIAMLREHTKARVPVLGSRDFVEDDQPCGSETRRHDQFSEATIRCYENAPVARGNGEDLAVPRVRWPVSDTLHIMTLGNQARAELRAEAVIDQQLHS